MISKTISYNGVLTIFRQTHIVMICHHDDHHMSKETTEYTWCWALMNTMRLDMTWSHMHIWFWLQTIEPYYLTVALQPLAMFLSNCSFLGGIFDQIPCIQRPRTNFRTLRPKGHCDFIQVANLGSWTRRSSTHHIWSLKRYRLTIIL